MHFQYASDCHTHSDCSPDGHSPAQEMLRQAGALGLYAYTLTDHCECQKYEEKYKDRVALAKETMREIAPQAADGLRFYFGLELGQPTQNLPVAEQLTADETYDFILGSLHDLKSGENFGAIYRGILAGDDPPPAETVTALVEEYLTELLEIVRWGKFDSLAHITYPLRYLFPAGSSPDYRAQQELLEEVLSELIKRDKALEMNTSRLWRDNGPKLPDLEVFTLYRKMGGKLVTLGSDAHSADRVGNGIELGMELLQKAGFKEFAVYEKHRPILLPLN